MSVEWDGETLYRTDAGVRVEVGYVQPAIFGDGWDVMLAGDRYEMTCFDEAQARRLLEGYA